MAYLEVEVDVEDIDWEYELDHTCMSVIDKILEAHEDLVGELREKLKAPKPDPRLASRKAIEKLSLENKKKLFDELFSDMLPNEIEEIKQILITKYNG